MSVRDVIQAAAGASTTADKTYIEDVFSTHLYTGASAGNVNINNGIDLAGKGGMVWQKSRDTALSNYLVDTARGSNKYLISDSSNAEGTSTALVYSFNSNGFDTRINTAATVASWTFRKAPKFFDVVTYTGNGVAGRTVAHSLGQAPGMIIVKGATDTGDWRCYHRSLGNDYAIYLDSTEAKDGPNKPAWNLTSPTSTHFTVASNGWNTNNTGVSYVAYLFAHDTTTDGLIQCGSFTAPSSGTLSVNLGWEAQFLLIKRTNSTGGWYLIDNMRGFSLSGTPTLYANTSGSELPVGSSPFDATYRLNPTATGFELTSGAITGDYIYMAIRRGPMRTPTDGTKVFSPVVAATNSGLTAITSNFPVDMAMARSASATWIYNSSVNCRLIGADTRLITSSANAETTSAGTGSFASNTAYLDSWAIGNTKPLYHLFRRAPGFFDVVCYTGTGSARTVNHNLGVAPELIIAKNRNNGGPWPIYQKDLGVGSTARYTLNTNIGPGYGQNAHFYQVPTATQFYVGTDTDVNGSAGTYVAYLFASCPGVSKVFSFTGNGSSQTINCGFTNGARLVLIKRTDSTGDWYVWDTARGIVAGNDPHLSLNSTAAEVTTNDTIDPDSTGFIVNQVSATNVNVNGASYIGLAIA